MKELWVEKYRPSTLEGYVFKDDTLKEQITKWIKDGSIPHILLSGNAGTGKTTLAKLLLNEIGVQDTDNKTILIDDLLSQKYIHFCNKMYGIWIPQKDILTRTAYSWFARMSKKQILQSNIILSKYLLLSNTPFEKKVRIVTEPKQSPPWISFWKVPLKAPLWGSKPNFLGDSILKSKYS